MPTGPRVVPKTQTIAYYYIISLNTNQFKTKYVLKYEAYSQDDNWAKCKKLTHNTAVTWNMNILFFK